MHCADDKVCYYYLLLPGTNRIIIVLTEPQPDEQKTQTACVSIQFYPSYDNISSWNSLLIWIFGTLWNISHQYSQSGFPCSVTATWSRIWTLITSYQISTLCKWIGLLKVLHKTNFSFLYNNVSSIFVFLVFLGRAISTSLSSVTLRICPGQLDISWTSLYAWCTELCIVCHWIVHCCQP